MTINSLIDLSALPTPEVIEPLSFEAILQRNLATMMELWPDFSAVLESDPSVKLLETDAYDELLLRARINDAARDRLLAFAAGGNLEHLAAFYGVQRLSGETDDALRLRTRVRTMGYSAAGGAAHYRYHAMSAATGIREVSVDSPAGGEVRVSVLADSGDGTAPPDMLEAVAAAVQADDVRSMCHTVAVQSADIIHVTVVANVVLVTNAAQAIFDGLAQSLADEFEAAKGLGWNVTRSWLTAKLHAGGVQSVDLLSPVTDIVIAPHQCAALSVDLTLAGRDY